MAFGGKVDHRINIVFPEQGFYKDAVAYIAALKKVPGAAKAPLNVTKAGGISRVSQGVQIDDPPGKVRRFFQKQPDEVAADKPRAARNQEVL
jgi:hypothetical protein